MRGTHHYAEAERVRSAIRTPHDASQQGFDGWQRDDLIALAQFHATMAQVEYLREISDQLDRLPHSVRMGIKS